MVLRRLVSAAAAALATRGDGTVVDHRVSRALPAAPDGVAKQRSWAEFAKEPVFSVKQPASRTSLAAATLLQHRSGRRRSRADVAGGWLQQEGQQLGEIGAMVATRVREHAFDADDEYKMFETKDTVSWVVFFIFMCALVLFDNLVLHRSDKAISFRRAVAYMVFWLLCAASFNVYVYAVRGSKDAWNWGTGYLLEWMFSVDNLFVFRSIFVAFKTPDSQKHKALFWGIVGAVIFRMFFFVVEEVLLHTFSFMHVVLGLFLVYTGVKILLVEDTDISPEEDPVVQRLCRALPYVNAYAPAPLFFARMSPASPFPRWVAAPGTGEADPTGGTGAAGPQQPARDVMVVDNTQPLKATKLLLVVVCLEVTDAVFAVDSVSTIVAQIPDLFLAYTACVFAMLGLRATFFVVDEMVGLFSLLPYAMAAILMFIGVKLCCKGWVHVPHEVTCAVLVTSLGVSMVASVLYDRCRGGVAKSCAPASPLSPPPQPAYKEHAAEPGVVAAGQAEFSEAAEASEVR